MKRQTTPAHSKFYLLASPGPSDQTQACSSPGYWGEGLYTGATYPLSKASVGPSVSPSLLTLFLPLLSFLLCLQLLSYTKTRSVLYERFHCHNLPGKRQPSTGNRKAHLRNKQTDRQTNSWVGFGPGLWHPCLGISACASKPQGP